MPAEAPIEMRRVIAFLAMVFGMFMAILDIQIVSASLAEIQAGLSASSDEIPWVQTAYLIAEVIMIPFSGYLSRLMSTSILFVISAVGFTLMSVELYSTTCESCQPADTFTAQRAVTARPAPNTGPRSMSAMM